MLKQRLITAALLAPLFVVAIIWFNSPTFACLMAAIMILGAWEWSSLLNMTQTVLRQGLYIGSMLVLFALSYWGGSPLWMLYAIVGSLLWLVLTLWVARRARPDQLKPDRFWAALGLVVFTIAWTSLVALHQDFGPYYALYVIVLVWVADSAAYFSGRRFGKRPLLAHVSPKKTIEGMLGGLIGCGLFALITSFWADFSLVSWLVTSVLAAFFSVFGDLFESLFKRQYNTKDSSQLLPGHGGILDRFDSLLAAAPIFVMGLWLS